MMKVNLGDQLDRARQGGLKALIHAYERSNAAAGEVSPECYEKL
jgi:hypothetical protein